MDAVGGIDLQVIPGEIVGLVGGNGAGKSTTMRIIAGTEAADSGEVSFLGRPINHLALFRRARLGISYLPQHASVFPELTIRDNLELALNIQPDSASDLPELVEAHGLGARLDQRVGLLSGGERRRVEIVRMLLMRPKLLLLDEPFAGLDAIHLDYLAKVFRDLAAGGMGLLLADHNAHIVADLCDRMLIIDSGIIQMRGAPDMVAVGATIQNGT